MSAGRINNRLATKTSKYTKEIGSLQKGADFVKAYALGFDVNVSPTISLPLLACSIAFNS